MPVSIETPERRDGQPSVFKLPEVISLDQDSRISIIRGVQCPYGALSPKPSEMLGTMALRDWVRECPHPAQAWRVPWSGKRHMQPHPPLRGRQGAIPEADWCKSMLRRRMPGGPWLTQESENYPPEFNSYIAKTLVLHARARLVLREQQASSFVVPIFGSSSLSQNWDTNFQHTYAQIRLGLDVRVGMLSSFQKLTINRHQTWWLQGGGATLWSGVAWWLRVALVLTKLLAQFLQLA